MWDLLTPARTTSTYNAAADIHTANHRMLSLCCTFTSRSLAMASNSGDYSASRAQVLFLQPPMRNWTLNCQLNYSAISFLPPLQSSILSYSLSRSRSLLPAISWQRSFLASSPAVTHGHRSVQCQDLCVLFSSLFLPLVKGWVGLFI
jgi:hypothetical protein